MVSAFVDKWGFYWLFFVVFGVFLFGSANLMGILFGSTGLTLFCIIASTATEIINKIDEKYIFWFILLLFGIGIGIVIAIFQRIFNFIG
jgi:hypothetical protein